MKSRHSSSTLKSLLFGLLYELYLTICIAEENSPTRDLKSLTIPLEHLSDALENLTLDEDHADWYQHFYVASTSAERSNSKAKSKDGQIRDIASSSSTSSQSMYTQSY